MLRVRACAACLAIGPEQRCRNTRVDTRDGGKLFFAELACCVVTLPEHVYDFPFAVIALVQVHIINPLIRTQFYGCHALVNIEDFDVALFAQINFHLNLVRPAGIGRLRK